jgi:hypothetical protein
LPARFFFAQPLRAFASLREENKTTPAKTQRR